MGSFKRRSKLFSSWVDLELAFFLFACLPRGFVVMDEIFEVVLGVESICDNCDNFDTFPRVCSGGGFLSLSLERWERVLVEEEEGI